MQKIVNYLKKEIKPYRSLFALFCYTLFSFIFTFPLIFKLNQFVIGDLEGDMWKHLWGFWWVRKRIFEDGVLPLFTSLLNYPYGGDLFFIDPLGALISIPFQSFLPVTVVYNLVTIGNLILGAFAAYLAACYFTRNRSAAFYSGAAYAFSAYMLSYITSGVSETYNIAWIPLFIYYLARTLEEKNDTNAVMAGISIFLAALGSFYYGSFATIYGILFIAYFIVSDYVRMYRVEKKKQTDYMDKKTVSPSKTLLPVRQKKYSFFTFKLMLKNAWKKTRISGLIYIILTLISLVTIVLYLPGIIAGESANAAGSLHLALLMLAFFTGSAFFTYRHFKIPIKKAVRSVENKFFSEKPSHTKFKIFFIIVLYAISALGAIHYNVLIKKGEIQWAASLGMIAAGVFLLALTATILQIISKKAGGLSTLKKNCKIYLPWVVFVFALINFLRIASAYEDFIEGFGVKYISIHLSLSLIMILGVLAYVKKTKLYLEWSFFLDHFIDPRLPKRELSPAEKRRLIKKNFISTAALFLSITVPPVVFILQGFLVSKVVSLWSAFIVFSFVTAGLIHLLTRSSGVSKEKKDKEEESFGLMAYLKHFAKGPLRRLFILSVVALALVGPLFYAFKVSLDEEQGLVKRERTIEFMDLYLSRRFQNICSLWNLIETGKENVTRTYTVDRLTRSSYAGFITLLLALSSIILARKRKYLWFWILSAVLFIKLSLGPYLYVTEHICMDNPSPLYIFLYKYFPFFNHISIPLRFNICAMLGLSVLAGYAISEILKKWSSIEKKLAVGVLSLSMLFEVCLFSTAPYPMPLSDLTVPEFYHRIAADEEEYGIIDSPIQRVKGELLPGEYFYYQMTHGKGIPYKVEGTIPVYIYENQFTVYLFNMEKGYSVSPPEERVLRQYLDELKKNRFKYIVVHNQYLKHSARERVHTFLRHFLGEPEITEGDLHVYQIY